MRERKEAITSILSFLEDCSYFKNLMRFLNLFYIFFTASNVVNLVDETSEQLSFKGDSVGIHGESIP